MINRGQEIPFNPFVRAEEGIDYDPVAFLTLDPDTVPRTAEGFENLANEKDWSQPELNALHDAARFVGHAARLGSLSEYEVIENRKNYSTGITLVLREVLDVSEPELDSGEGVALFSSDGFGIPEGVAASSPSTTRAEFDDLLAKDIEKFNKGEAVDDKGEK
jgi:hypothetical protein